LFYSSLFVKVLPEKVKVVYDEIKKIENVIEVTLLEFEKYGYNILVIMKLSDFKSLNSISIEIENINGVETTVTGLPWGENWRPDSQTILNDKMAYESYNRYFDIVQSKKVAKFLIAKRLSANFNKNDSLINLWNEHDTLLNKFYLLEKEIDLQNKSSINLKKMGKPEKSFLDLKIEISKRILENCHFCNRRCGINRLVGKLGYCKCGSKIAVSNSYKHWGEESELVPAGAVFTFGCSIHCLFCLNWRTSQWFDGPRSKLYSPRDLGKELENLHSNGCRNAYLTGEPTPWLQQWLEAFKYIEANIPVVWNSNAYYSEEAAKLLAGFVDLYVLDFKYGSNECAEKISDATNYMETCTRNYMSAKKFGELLIRVLILPGHSECCTKTRFSWIAKNLGKNVRTNIMTMYRPTYRSNEIPELRRKLTINEIEYAIKLASDEGLINIIK
jgi:putative pyruvate formate lyase activating enzyme